MFLKFIVIIQILLLIQSSSLNSFFFPLAAGFVSCFGAGAGFFENISPSSESDPRRFFFFRGGLVTGFGTSCFGLVGELSSPSLLSSSFFLAAGLTGAYYFFFGATKGYSSLSPNFKGCLVALETTRIEAGYFYTSGGY